MDEFNQKGDAVETDFEQFWKELMEWWNFGPFGKEEEEVTLKVGRREYRLRCRWDDSLLLVGMASPWVGEWDYAQLLRTREYGYSHPVVGGFCRKGVRRGVVRLLLEEIVRFQKWMSTTPWEVEKRERSIKRVLASFDEQIRTIQQAQKDLAEAQMNHEKRRGGMPKSKFIRKSKVLEERGKSLEEDLCSVESKRDEYSKPWFVRYKWRRDGLKEADWWIERNTMVMNRVVDTSNGEQHWDPTGSVKLALANAGLK